MRPSIIGATLAGWEIRYNSFFNMTIFTKGLIAVGLFKPLMNLMDSVPTPTPTAVPTNTLTATPTFLPSSTPTLVGAYVSTTVNVSSISVGATAVATVRLNNVPAEGYASAEFTCTYNPALVEVSNILVAGLFGADPVTAINAPQNGSFIVAIAGSNGSKATTSGTVFTFDLEALGRPNPGGMPSGRRLVGDNVLTAIGFIPDSLMITGDTATSTPTPVDSPTLW